MLALGTVDRTREKEKGKEIMKLNFERSFDLRECIFETSGEICRSLNLNAKKGKTVAKKTKTFNLCDEPNRGHSGCTDMTSAPRGQGGQMQNFANKWRMQ